MIFIQAHLMNLIVSFFIESDNNESEKPSKKSDNQSDNFKID